MRYGKRWILLLTAVLVLAAGAIRLWEPEAQPEKKAQEIPLLAQVHAEGRIEQITCWENENGQCYLFLPAFADLSQTELLLKSGAKATLDGGEIKNEQTCGSIQLGKHYVLEYTWEGKAFQKPLTFLRSSQIPSMHIRTQSGNMDYIHEVKGNQESGSIHIYNTDGRISYNGNLQSISGRGQGSWFNEKKPYALTLAGEADLLGMGAAQRWALLANYADHSHLRNKLVYDYAAEVGMPYSPESGWVDLYLNGEYAGLYQLSEQNEIHPQRVALDENSGFLVSLEWSWRMEDQAYSYFRLNSGFSLRVRQSAAETETLAQLWQSAENAILAEDGIDPVTGKVWTDLIDAESWARKFLVEEIFGSLDAGAVSQFFYGSMEEGKIYAGPVWDFDLAMGNASLWQLSQPEAFFANRERVSAWLPSSWFHPLYQKEEFYDLVVQLYRDEYRPLLEVYLTENLESYASVVRDAGEMNRNRWNIKSVEEETDHIRSYMLARMEFLDSLWLDGEQWYTILVDVADGGNTACYAVRPGDPLPELPNAYEHWDPLGWYHRETDEPVDLSQPVTGNMDIYQKYPETERDSEEEKTESGSRIPIWTKAPVMVLGVILLITAIWDLLRQTPRFSEKKK